MLVTSVRAQFCCSREYELFNISGVLFFIWFTMLLQTGLYVSEEITVRQFSFAVLDALKIRTK